MRLPEIRAAAADFYSVCRNKTSLCASLQQLKRQDQKLPPRLKDPNNHEEKRRV
jgi:hypothetical protein